MVVEPDDAGHFGTGVIELSVIAGVQDFAGR
jgi:hypothetical protein